MTASVDQVKERAIREKHLFTEIHAHWIVGC